MQTNPLAATLVRRWPRRAPLAIVAIIGIAFAAAPLVAQQAADASVEEELAHAKALSRAFRRTAETATPTVVTVQSTVNAQQSADGASRQNPFEGTPFEEYFNDPRFEFRGGAPQRMGMGAGVIIDAAGVILTNNHVVEDADKVVVKLSDGREFTATEVKTDPQSDIAVVRISAGESLPAAKIGDSDKMEIGDWVIAIGNPFSQELTVSAGIISGKGRSLQSGQRTAYLQTDAAINPGNSGGPLVNLEGEVIGINTAIASNSGGFQGVGFSIPINHASWIAEQLLKRGSVERAYIGVVVSNIEGQLAEKFAARRSDGVLVHEVSRNAPAAKAGIKSGDIITTFAGKHVGSPSELQAIVERAPISSEQPVTVLRNGEPMTFQVVVEPLPDPAALARGSQEDGAETNELGVAVAELTDEMAQQLGFEGYRGVVITDVNPDSPAAREGLRAGMLILKVGPKEVATAEEFAAVLGEQSLEKGVLLLVRSAGQGNRFVVIRK